MSLYYIYKTTCLITNKSYIGQHKVPSNKEADRRYLGSGIAIRAAIKMYGKSNFVKEILEYIEDDDKHEKVSEREKYWIAKENTMSPNGYNISPGGEGGITSEIAMRSAQTRKEKGYHHSDETKIQISTSNKGKPKSEVHKRHLRDHHRLKTLHKVLHEDGTIEETYASLQKIAKQHHTNQNTLLRYSAKKKFVNGIYLMNIEPSQYQCCSEQNDKEKRKLLCKDPVTGDICTLCALRNRKYKHKEMYYGVNVNECVIVQEEKNET